MGCVYRARMEGPAGAAKEVALKLIHAHMAEDHDFVLMFLDETRLAMALSHRNIVQTFDAGQVDGRYFMVMELLTGCSLRTLLDRLGGRRLPLDIAMFIGREVSAALAYAHRFQPEARGQPGVVHRDVSPSNILLSGEGDVKLADFGVAKAAGRLYVTSANLIRGKMMYMAPEQASGRAEPRSDLYALGAVLYEMLTGQPARRAVGLDDLLLAGRPVAPSELRGGLSPALDELVLSCLDAEPGSRPASADVVRQTLATASFQIQLSTAGQGLDPHVRLKSFLSELGLLAELAEPPESTGGADLARAVLAQARAMETDPDLPILGEASEEFTGEGDLTPLVDGGHPRVLQEEPTPFGGDDPPTPVARQVATPFADGPPTTPSRQAATPLGGDPPTTPARQEATPFADDDGLVETFDEAMTDRETRSPRPPAGGPGAPSGRPRLRLLHAVVAALALAGAGGVIWFALPAEGGPDPGEAGARDAAAAPPDRTAGRGLLPSNLDTGIPDHRVGLDVSHDLARDRSAARAPDAGPAPPADGGSPAQPALHRAAGTGVLDINSIPWARVYVDGRYQGETPRESLRVRAGVVTVKLVSPVRGVTRTFKVRVWANRRTRRVFDLTRGEQR